MIRYPQESIKRRNAQSVLSPNRNQAGAKPEPNRSFRSAKMADKAELRPLRGSQEQD